MGGTRLVGEAGSSFLTERYEQQWPVEDNDFPGNFAAII
jgi:hypothetical protein